VRLRQIHAHAVQAENLHSQIGGAVLRRQLRLRCERPGEHLVAQAQRGIAQMLVKHLIGLAERDAIEQGGDQQCRQQQAA